VNAVQPLEQTIDALSKSRNEAATPTLLAALETKNADAFTGAVRALVARRSKQGHLAVLKLWHELSPELKQLVDDSQGRMGGALRDALLAKDDQLFANACEVAHESGEFDLAPTLITVAERAAGPRSRLATRLVVEMVERIGRLETGAETTGYSRHPETIRRCVLESLERSVERFEHHGRKELNEAFVVLAGAESPALRAILDLQHHACYQTVVNMLTESANPAVLNVLITFLANQDAPLVVRSIIAKRVDQPFVEALLAMPRDPANSRLLKNLGRMKSIACLDAIDAACTLFAPPQQAAAMWLVARTGASDEAKLDLAAAFLARASQPGRVAACEALADIAGQRSNELVLSALADMDADVQAAATRQLRDRHIPGTMARLIQLLNSRHAVVVEAAREALGEFSFDSLVARYETMDDETRRATGALVARVDQNALPRLREELASMVRRHRLRAVEIAGAMGVAPQVADALIERLEDEDHMVRAAAAEALQWCSGSEVRSALMEALNDRSFAVQSAARSSLNNMGIEIDAPAAREA
jgi:HEAT repeat protein